jgi:hypothetical protein
VPWSAELDKAAADRIAPSVGPTHGVHASANAAAQ